MVLNPWFSAEVGYSLLKRKTSEGLTSLQSRWGEEKKPKPKKSCETWTFSTPPPAKETFCSESSLQGTLRRTRVSITGFCLALLGSRSKLTEDKILFTGICAFFSLHFYFPFRNMIELNLPTSPQGRKKGTASTEPSPACFRERETSSNLALPISTEKSDYGV